MESARQFRRGKGCDDDQNGCRQSSLKNFGSQARKLAIWHASAHHARFYYSMDDDTSDANIAILSDDLPIQYFLD